jgi:uncharacterized protein involved in response to NO
MIEPITRETSVREAIARFPGAEAIFDRHGLGGCGGPDGPQEPIGFFATIHRVDADALIAALNEHARSGAASEAAPAPTPAPQPYRWFLATALILTVAGGVTSGIAAAATGRWGGLTGEPWLALVQAHGHLQLFGFIVLFIAGIALHVLPRFKQLSPPPPAVVYPIFGLLVSGVLLRALAQPHGAGWLRPPFVASSVVLFAGVLLFAVVVVRILRARERRETLDFYAIPAVALLVLAAGANVYLAADAVADGRRYVSAPGEEALLLAVTQGFVVLFVIGVSTRVLPFFLSLQPPREPLLRWAAVIIGVLVPVRAFAGWSPGLTADLGVVEHAAAFGFAGATVAAVVGLRVFEPPASDETNSMTPPAFFTAVRVAFAWLVAAVMLDAYWQLRAIDGTPAPMYPAGAVRHAYLLGFATLMILAMASRIVPVFSGRPLPWRSLVPVVFAMVGAAAVLRVFPVAFALSPTGVDFNLMIAGGVLLFVGVSLFTAQIFVSMFGRPSAATDVAPAHVPEERAGAPAPAAPPQDGGAAVHAGMTVAEALAAHPAVLKLLIDRGFGPLANAQTRAAMAPITTLERAASFVGASPDDLVAYVNAGIAASVGNGGAAASTAADTGPAVRTIDTTADPEAVLEALKSCYDPEVPVNVVDLGLVYGVLVRDTYARVTMSMTSPGCPAADMLADSVARALTGVDGIDAVDVEVVDEPAWTPDRITPAGRARLGMA